MVAPLPAGSNGVDENIERYRIKKMLKSLEEARGYAKMSNLIEMGQA